MTVSTEMQIPVPGRASTWAVGALQTPLLFLAAAALYTITIGTTPVRVDEYYTTFAARSWAENGSFAILDGEYTRARLFTMLIGAAFDLFGSTSIWIARVPTALMAAGLVTLVFAWVKNRAGTTAAIIAALTLALSGYTLDVAHFTRFYAPQALLVLGAAILIYAAAAQAGTAMVWRLAGAAALLLLGLHLQPTTAIAAAALALWFAAARFQWIMAMVRRRPWLALITTVSCVIFAVMILPPMMQKFLSASVWAQEHQYDRLFYLREFYRQIPLILILTPVAAALALRRDRSLALLSIIMISVALLVHSFAAMKAGRYVYYAMPFVAILFGLAVARPADAALAAGRRVLSGFGLPSELAGIGAGAIVLGVGVTALLVNSSYRHTASALLHGLTDLRSLAHLSDPSDPLWDEQEAALRRAVGPADFLVASDDLRTIVHIRPHDMLINPSHLSDLGATRDFTRDVRTGRPVLGSAAGMDRVINCRASGVIVIDDAHWRTAKGVPAEVADLIEQRTSPVRPAVPYFHIFRWEHRPTAPCPWMSSERHAA
ncbi:hypothetical protein C1T17_12700 [Sphingobium sp. SCG-1]|uniref:hypothetical protein n=1 Tax=Sphingobium sp. SCG-1 TaxID=2072936 RepID=UPI000CD679A4|nr:hypothetical protein [Sphingobium sp. SCG-1]AUW58821.1 hypothetical protein C1T17_12700 [Sphingobium sp. SCG-1]